MSSQPAVTDQSLRLHTLWTILTDELASVFDAHGVCAIVASRLASLLDERVIFGLQSPLGKFYDVWLADPATQLKQMRWSVDEASFESLIDANQAQTVAKRAVAATTLLTSSLWEQVDTQLLSVPVPFQPSPNSPSPPGLLCIVDPGPEALLTAASLEPFSSFITTFIDRAYLRQRSVQQEIIFDVVMDISHSLSSTLSLERIYSELLDPVRRVMNVETISIGLTEPGTGDIVFIGALMGALFDDLPAIRLKPGQGIAGWVTQHAQPVIVNDTYHDHRFYSKVDRLSGFKTNNMLCVPLTVDKRVIGVLQAINKQVGVFAENDLRLFQAISGPLAAAIENASLHANVLAEKQRIQTIFSSMSEGMLTVDGNGRITAANDSLLALLHVDEADVVGESVNEVILLREGDFGTFIAEVMVAENDYRQLPCEVAQGDGQYAPVLVSGAMTDNEDVEINEVILVFSDLSQIREVERMRDDFFHNIVHELRTPLATILMYARLLREGKAAGEPEKIERFLGVIERESDRLQTMVRQTLQLAKLGAREIQRSSELVSINELLNEMLPPLADQAQQKGLTFEQAIDDNLPRIIADRETLYIIFKNLVENAIKFTLSGRVRVEASVVANYVRVAVHDQGIGIPDAALPNLFKRFYRARTAVERGIAGTGLGLYMVKEGVEKHNGTLEVASVVGEGTTFTVHLPFANV